METILESTTCQDRIKLPLKYSVESMTKELKALKFKDFEYYQAVPFRSPAHIVDPSLPIPPPAADYADGSWTEWMNTPDLNSSPYFQKIIRYFQSHTKVTLVRLLRLAPKSVVKEHTDPTLGLDVERSVVRLTIPIVTNDNVEFYLDNTIVPMEPGECWYLDLTKPHKVINDGTTERINLTIDMIPNTWLRELIESSSD